MDDKAFQASIIETQVMLTPRDHTKWNFDILFALVEGPLRNAKRMEEAIRVTKFMRRLMSFFHPCNNRFSDIKKLPVSQKYCPACLCWSPRRFIGRVRLGQAGLYALNYFDGECWWSSLSCVRGWISASDSEEFWTVIPSKIYHIWLQTDAK